MSLKYKVLNQRKESTSHPTVVTWVICIVATKLIITL